MHSDYDIISIRKQLTYQINLLYKNERILINFELVTLNIQTVISRINISVFLHE